MQVKASEVSPPICSPVHSSSSSAAAAAAAAAASHPMSHQSYPTYHHHNPYYPGMDLAYFGGQQYNMANSAAMFRSDAYDAYQQAASAERYQLL
jgi:hypothetical protein